MLIRSQDKKTIYNIDNMTALSCTNRANGTTSINFAYGTGSDVIAEYPSEEKAIEVLDQLQESYIRSITILTPSLIEDTSSYWVDLKANSSIFQMPR